MNEYSPQGRAGPQLKIALIPGQARQSRRSPGNHVAAGLLLSGSGLRSGSRSGEENGGERVLSL